eukprot:3615710-Ditylum_brightwellii.AAC.1
MDADGYLSWNEWRFWCLWALRTHPEQISNLDDLHSVVFRNAILPLSLHDKMEEIVTDQRQSTATGLMDNCQVSNFMPSSRGVSLLVSSMKSPDLPQIEEKHRAKSCDLSTGVYISAMDN